MSNPFKEPTSFKFGTAVRIKTGVIRKPWEWIGNVEIVSGNMAAIAWRVALPGTNGKRPVTHHRLNDLEVLDRHEESVSVDTAGRPVFA